jgi:hypothetical chaperone protein
LKNSLSFGFDFGTTNSSLACASRSGEVQLLQFPTAAGWTESFRSLLYLEKQERRAGHHTKVWSGPAAIEAYLEADPKGRLVQSLKSFLTSRSLTSTDIFGKLYKLEDLIARILREIRDRAEAHFGVSIRSAVVGCPVWFVGANSEADNEFARSRLAAAFQLAGFEDIRFELEPIGAAFHYQSTLDHEELILIGDFGGGTSDFSLVKLGPAARSGARRLFGNAGVGIAGDAFDAKIVRNVVSPALGAGSEMRSGGKILPVPTWIYGNLERWHHVSFLKSRDTMNMLRNVEKQALEPEKVQALVHFIKEDLGYYLHQSVQRLKVQLSAEPEADFRFDDGFVSLRSAVRRADFERWIQDELNAIENCVDGLMQQTGIDRRDVDRVFLTGGTSFVPAVQRIFESRFGADRISAGHEFTSVARGLALSAQAAKECRP